MIDLRPEVVTLPNDEPVYWHDKITVTYDSLEEALNDAMWVDMATVTARQAFSRKLDEGFFCDKYVEMVCNRLHQDNEGRWCRELTFEAVMRPKIKGPLLAHRDVLNDIDLRPGQYMGRIEQ